MSMIRAGGILAALALTACAGTTSEPAKSANAKSKAGSEGKATMVALAEPKPADAAASGPGTRPADAIDLVASPRPASLKVDGKLDEWKGAATLRSVPARGVPALERQTHEAAQDDLERKRAKEIADEKTAAKKEKREPKLLPPYERVPFAEPPEQPAKSSVRVSPGKDGWVLAGSIDKAAGEQIVIALEEQAPEPLSYGIMMRGGGVMPIQCEDRTGADKDQCEAVVRKNEDFLSELRQQFHTFVVIGKQGVSFIDEAGKPVPSPKEGLSFGATPSAAGFDFELMLPLSALPLTMRPSLDSVLIAAAPRSAFGPPKDFLDEATKAKHRNAEYAFPLSTLAPDRWRTVPVQPELSYDPNLDGLELARNVMTTMYPREYYYSPSDPSAVRFQTHADGGMTVTESTVPLAVKAADIGKFQVWRYAGSVFALRGPEGIRSMPFGLGADLIGQTSEKRGEILMFQQENYDPEAGMSMVTLSAVKIDEEGNVEDVNVEDPIPQDGMLAGCEAGPGTGKGGVFVRTCTIQVFGPDGMPRGRQATYRNGYKRAMQAFLLLDGKSMVDAKTLREMEQMMRDVDRIEAEAKKFEQEQARLNGSGK